MIWQKIQERLEPVYAGNMQSNFSYSNIFGIMEICSRHEEFEHWELILFVGLSLLTMTNPNQLCGVLLFVCSKMADETNLSSKLPVADRTREIWGRKLCLWCLSSGFPLCTFLLGFAYSFCFVFILMRPRHFVRSCAICSHDSVGMLKSLKEALRVSLYRFFWPHGSVFQLVVLHRGFSLVNVHQAFW